MITEVRTEAEVFVFIMRKFPVQEQTPVKDISIGINLEKFAI